MSVAIRSGAPSFTQISGTGTLSITLSGTSQPQAGDVLIIITSNDYYALSNMSTPTVGGSTTGVTSIVNADKGTNASHIKSYYYVVSSTGNLTVAFSETGTADEERILVVYVLSGADTTTPIDGSGAAATISTSSTSFGAPSVSPSTATGYLICHVQTDGNAASFTPPSGMTETYDSFNTPFCVATGAIQQLSASGATGTKTFTAATANTGVAVSFVVKAGSTSTPKSDSDTGTGTDNAGTVVQKYTGTDIGTGTDAGSITQEALSGTDTGSGADSAGTVVQKYTGTDTGTGTDSSGSVEITLSKSGSDTGTGVDSAGAVAELKSGTETGAGAEDTTGRTVTSVDAGAGAEDTSGRTVTSADTASESETEARHFFGAETVGSVDADALTRPVSAPGDTFTAIEGVSGKIQPAFDNPTIVEAASVANLTPVPKSDAETVSRAEGQTVLTPGNFTQIPSPKTWSNGDDLYAGTLNKEWRDAFLWLLRKTVPAFSGYNDQGGSLTYTSNVAVPIRVEELKRGNITHATNDTKVYVWEDGWYEGSAQLGVSTGSITGGTTLTSVVKVNGLVRSTSDQTRSGGSLYVATHKWSLYLEAGDYVEIALAGTWSGTASSNTALQVAPFLSLWWRDNNAESS